MNLPPFVSPVNGAFGAPMGRKRTLPADLSTVTALSLSFVPFVDGDYDAGGAYWGGGKDSEPLFCVWGDGVETYLRAADYAAALSEAQAMFPAATITNAGLSDFARAYVEAALWLMDESDEGGKEIDDIDPDTLSTMAQEADTFAAQTRADIQAAELEDSRAGHCLWLDRNGHGSGFWDEYSGDDPRCAACDRLSKAADKLGVRNLYRGDDGKMYQE